MSKIPTAEEFLKSKDYNLGGNEELADGLLTNNVIEDMIEFARKHVIAALKEASKEAEGDMIFTEDGDKFIKVNKNSILDAYPLENIK